MVFFAPAISASKRPLKSRVWNSVSTSSADWANFGSCARCCWCFADLNFDNITVRIISLVIGGGYGINRYRAGNEKMNRSTDYITSLSDCAQQFTFCLSDG